MRITRVHIRHFRTVEDMEITFPLHQPVVLFGANKAGKSNVMEALDRLLGPVYPTHRDLRESDRFLNGKTCMDTAEVQVHFDEPLYTDARFGPVDALKVVYGAGGVSSNNLLYDGRRHRIHPRDEERAHFQSVFLRSSQRLDRSVSFSEDGGLLERLIQRILERLGDEQQSGLSQAMESVRDVFRHSREYGSFCQAFTESLQGSLSGFVAFQETDAHAGSEGAGNVLRVLLTEKTHLDEGPALSRGEEQVLILSIFRAWTETFPEDHFLLMIEEPENHLHPLAQKWLHEFLCDMCSHGMQVLIATHSTDFIEARHLEGLVRIWRENGISHARQLSPSDLYEFCIQSGASRKRISRESITDFYATRLFTEQLRGLFSETVLLVEGATEYCALPEFFRRISFSLPGHGVEIINCEGKSSISLYARLFRAYGYHVYCLFDGDEKGPENSAMFRGICHEEEWVTQGDACVIRDTYAYFGKDYETYFRSVIPDWENLERHLADLYRIPTKPGIARGIAIHCKSVPDFFPRLAEKLEKLRKQETGIAPQQGRVSG